MSDFQQVRKRTGKDATPSVKPTIKFPTQHQQLVDMGFDANEVQKILEQTRGDLEKATSILLGEESSQPTIVEESFQEKKSNRKGTMTSVSLPSNNSKEVTDAHKKMMGTYKVYRCKDISNATHDRKMCQYWHSSSDRRRNPFEFPYSCYECPNVAAGTECKDGDKCPHSHNMLERMFHPELFKISMCQRLQDGKKCDRGIVCAFAHSDSDLRVSPSKLDPSLAEKPPAKPVTTDIVIPEEVKERLIQLIKDAGSEGIHSSELHKKYQQKFEEALEISDNKYAAKLKLKEMLESNPSISLIFTRGSQPIYVHIDSKKEKESDPSAAVAAAPESGSSNNQKEQTPAPSATNVAVVKDRLVEVVKNSGSDGLYGSDLPKKYFEAYGERLELNDESGNRLKFKDVFAAYSSIITKGTKFQQPKYCYDATPKPPAKFSYSAIASAAAEKEKEKAKAAVAPTPTPAPTPAPQSSKSTKQHKEPKEKDSKETKEKEAAPAPVVAPQPAAPAVPAKKSFAAVLAAKAQSAAAAAAAAAAPVVAAAAPESTETNSTSTTPETDSVATKESPAETSESPVPVEEKKEEVVVPVEVPATPVVETPEVVAPQPAVVAAPPSLPTPVASEASSMSKLVPSVSITDSPVSLPPSVFPVSDSSLSSHGHDLLLFGIDKKAGESIDLPPQSKFHDLIYNLKPAPFANTPLSPDRSRSEHSLMPPGLTKQPKNEVNNNLLAQSMVHDETARKLAQSQSQVSSLQEQINSLKKELASSKSDYESQASQLKSTQQKLKEMETKVAMDTEPLKAQIKAKEEEFTTFYMQFQEELKRNMQERFTEMNQNITWFHQIEYAILNSKCEEINRDTISREDLLQFVHLLPTIRQFCANCKQQLKFKSDAMQRPTNTFLDPYASANRGYPMAAPYQNMYEQSYFPGQFAYGNGYNHGQAVSQAHQCAYTGCPQSGVIPCNACYSVYYCCAEHQHAHYSQHMASCGHHNHNH